MNDQDCEGRTHMNEFKVFNNTEFGEVRTVNRDNEPWFVAADICRALGLSQISRAMDRLDEDEKGLLKVPHPQNQSKYMDVNCINESGLYHLVLCSSKPEARAFKRWIIHDVLSAIRKHGIYATPQTVEQMLADPDTMIATLQSLNAECEKRLALEAQVEMDKPFTAFARDIANSSAAIHMGDFAKLVCNSGDIVIGRNRLFKWLREKEYLMSNNLPFQRYVEQGLFEVNEKHIDGRRGGMIRNTTLITGKGQVVLLNALRENLVGAA